MRRARPSSHETSACSQSRARSWPSWAPPAPARPPSRISINRFYDIADGKIRYDGISINNIRKPDLRRSLGIVLQDTNLFTGTVRENIRYGNLDATDEEGGGGRRPGQRRRLHPPSAPGGTTPCSPATAPACPRGQRQLLAIARAGRGRSAGDDPGRGHLLHRHPDGGHRPAGHGPP